VTGTKIEKGAAVAIDQPFERPTWDGNLYGITMGALPLKRGGKYRVPSYHYRSGLGEFTFDVIGEKTIVTPAGRQQAWVIDGFREPGQVARYFIAKKSRAELGYEAIGIIQSLGSRCPVESDADQKARLKA
jgi:hypothetical protein